MFETTRRFWCLWALLGALGCGEATVVTLGGGVDAGESIDSSLEQESDLGSDACAGARCAPGSECVDGECQCVNGYVLSGGVCLDLDECASGQNDCHADARCLNRPGGYECECVVGYSGSGRDCRDINECDLRLDNCADGAQCTNTDGGFECACREGFAGDGIACVDVDECRDGTATCGQGADCVNTSGGFECRCRPGWNLDGTECVDVDECAGRLDNCSDVAVCSNLEGGFECACGPGFVGDGVTCSDLNECESGEAACPANSACVNAVGRYECVCNPGYRLVDETCEDIDECAEGFGACDALGMCINEVGGYRCACPPGFRPDAGRCVDIDECADGMVQCGANARCLNTVGGSECVCDSGYFRDQGACLDVDECAMGVAACHVFADCVNQPGGYTCVCGPGFRERADGCEDINECEEGGVDCGPNATCANRPGSYGCPCDTGFRRVGEACVNIDECAEGVAGCSQNARCSDEPGGFSCRCDDGFAGDGFDCADVDECEAGLDDCPDGAACLNLSGGFECGPVTLYLCDCAEGATEDCRAGDDQASGDSRDTARRRLSQIDWLNLDPGTVVQLCRGGAFDGDLLFPAGMPCSAERPCRIGAYNAQPEEPDEGLPILNGRVVISDRVDGQMRGHLQLDGLAIRAVGNPGGAGLELMAGVEQVTISDVQISGWARGVLVGGRTTCGAAACPLPSHIRIEGARVVDNRVRGAELSGNDLTIERSDFSRNGGLEDAGHQVLLKCTEGAGCDRVTIRGNVFRETSGLEGGACAGAFVEVIGRTEDTRIESNDLRGEPGRVTSRCEGIVLGRSADGSPTGFQRARISGNRLHDVGSTAIGLSSCLSCVVENNVISQHEGVYSIAIRGPIRRGGGSHLVLDRLLVRNNSIFLGEAVPFTSIAIMVSGSGRGHHIVSNAIINRSLSRTTCCFDQAFDLTIYEAFDYNLCLLNPLNPRANWSLGFSGLADWQNASGYDTHSREVDPGFLNPMPPVFDFRATGAEAAMVDAGDPARSSPLDLEGRARVPPDVGAYEWVQP